MKFVCGYIQDSLSQVNFNTCEKFYVFKIYMSALLKFNNSLCGKTSCQYGSRVFIIFASTWILTYILGYWIMDIWNGIFHKLGYWIFRIKQQNSKCLSKKLFPRMLWKMIEWHWYVISKLKLQIVQEVKRRSDSSRPFTQHFCTFLTRISPSPYLRKGEDWWKVILYHFWLIIRDKKSKGEQFYSKFTIINRRE